MLIIALTALALAIILVPTRWDMAIIIKDYQMGNTSRSQFLRDLRKGLLISVALWASFSLIIWVIVSF